MSLVKAIKYGKEYRKPYKYKSNYAKSVSSHCRNQGSCDWCKSNRTHNNKRKELLGKD